MSANKTSEDNCNTDNIDNNEKNEQIADAAKNSAKKTKEKTKKSAASKSDQQAQDASPATETDSNQWSPELYPRLVFSWEVFISGETSFEVRVANLPNTSAAIDPDGKYPGEFLVTQLSKQNPTVPFSLYDSSRTSLITKGVLKYEEFNDQATLSVNDLKYPGGTTARQIFFPA